jgi:uncharacterized protein
VAIAKTQLIYETAASITLGTPIESFPFKGRVIHWSRPRSISTLLNGGIEIMAEKDTSNRGFGSMDNEKQREIASKGGKAAHEKGAAHEFDSEEAREAGRKGGETVSSDREHMSESGRKGGQHSHEGQQDRSHEQSRAREQGGSHERSRPDGSSEQHAEADRQSHKNS